MGSPFVKLDEADSFARPSCDSETEDCDEEILVLRFLGVAVPRLLPVDFVGLAERRARDGRVGVGGASAGREEKNLGGGWIFFDGLLSDTPET